MWWIVGIVAVWIVLGTLVGLWIGRSITRTDLEESASELRRTANLDKQPNCRGD